MRDPIEKRLSRYRRLLRAFPPAFRERWATEMESLCRFRLELVAGQRWQSQVVWSRIVLDALTGAAFEWIRELGRALRSRGVHAGTLRWDVRQAARGLRRTPGATIVAVATLALGIGAVATTFTVVDGVVLRPLPYDEPDRIVSVWPAANFNVAMVREVAEAAPALGHVAGLSTWTAVLSERGDPVEIDVARVSPAFFDVLGIAPALGRSLLPHEDRIDDAAVVVLSHGLWASRFGSDPDILGRAIRLSVDTHDVHTVVGVMPRDFRPPRQADAWAPLVDDPSLAVVDDSSWFVNHRIARLAPSATLEQANGQVRALAERMAPLVPNQFGPEQVAAAGVSRLKDDMTKDARGVLWALFGAVGLVLLIACANVSNVLLVRGEARRHDLAVRASLGASRPSLVRLLLVEALLLGVAGGTVGVAMAVGLTDLVVALAPAGLPRIAEIHVDLGVLAFSLALTLAATVIAGLWPAWRVSTGDLAGELGGSSRGAAGQRSSRVVSHTLIAAEIALAVVVALGSGLMLRSLDRLLSADIGFEPGGVVAFRPNPLGSGREGAESFRQFYSELMSQVAEAPGVRSVGAVQILTGTLDNWSFPTYPEGFAIPGDGALPDVNFRAVMPGYFETLGIPVLRGRSIEAADREDAQSAVVVNRAFTERFWPGEDALGKGVNVFGTEGEPLRVVGVVGDIRQHALSMEPRPELYVPYMAWPWEMSAWLLVRADAPEAFKAEVRRLVDRVDPNVPISSVEDLDRVVDRSAAETRFFTILLTAFGLLGLSLGAVGIYGVTAYTVVRRRAEFGVRVALGATRAEVIRTALRRGILPVVVGALAGLAFGLVGGRLLESYLYQIQPSDPLTLVLVTGSLTLVATVALAVPAWRAGRVDPVEVLNAG
jgi:putative ABC transport system permease protein